MPSIDQEYFGFGAAVAVEDDVVIIGSEGCAFSTEGHVFIYRFDRAFSEWRQEAVFGADELGADYSFGEAVALSGDFAFVAAPSDLFGLTGVFVFRYDGQAGTWQHETILSQDGVHNFGEAMAADGDRVLIGAPSDEGAAFLYQFDGVKWSETASIQSPYEPWDDLDFAQDVAIDGQHIVIGATSFFEPGRLLTYREQAGQWEATGELYPIDQQLADDFGRAIALANGIIAASAPFYDQAPAVNSGVICMYSYNDQKQQWSQFARYSPTDESYVTLGRGVALSEDRLFAGFLVIDPRVEYYAALAVYPALPIPDDCNVNGVPDICDDDCNGNGLADECDVASGFSADSNNNLLPDECESLQPCMLVESSRLQASRQGASDNFGSAVAADGDTLVVGSSGQNAVFLFRRVGDEWIEQDRLVGDDEDTGFGDSVFIVDDLLLVGSNGVRSDGAVYVFRYADGQWTEEQRLIPPDLDIEWTFGNAVAAHGDWIVVGTGVHFFMDAKHRAFVYEREGDEWVLRAELTGGDDSPWPDVAINDDLIFFGSSGEVRIYQIEAQAIELFQVLEPRDPDSFFDGFGASLDYDGTTLVVGRTSVDANLYYAGEVHGGQFVLDAVVTGSDPWLSDLFAQSVAIRGDSLAVGAPFDDDIELDSGSAFVFNRTADGWEEVAKLRASDGATDDFFGFDGLVVTGGQVIIGAKYNDVVATSAGAVYVFPATGCAQTCVWDLDDSGAVGTSDLIALLGAWGDPYDTADLIELLGNWGPCEA